MSTPTAAPVPITSSRTRRPQGAVPAGSTSPCAAPGCSRHPSPPPRSVRAAAAWQRHLDQVRVLARQSLGEAWRSVQALRPEPLEHPTCRMPSRSPPSLAPLPANGTPSMRTWPRSLPRDSRCPIVRLQSSRDGDTASTPTFSAGRSGPPRRCASSRQGSRAAQDGDAEVEYLHQAAVDEHHVGRLDVAVDDVDAGHRRALPRSAPRSPPPRPGSGALRCSPSGRAWLPGLSHAATLLANSVVGLFVVVRRVVSVLAPLGFMIARRSVLPCPRPWDGAC